MSLTGIIEIIDSNGLIGWATTPTSVLALDQDGAVVASSTPSNSPVRSYQQPRSWTMPPGSLLPSIWIGSTLSLPVDPNAAYPEMFSRVEWTMNVLVAQEVKTVDIPFKANETWVELTPGMEIMVEQATVEEGKYQYRIKLKYDRTKVEYLMSGSVSLWRDKQLPAVAVLKMDVLNAEGKSIRELSSNFGGGTGYQRWRVGHRVDRHRQRQRQLHAPAARRRLSGTRSPSACTSRKPASPWRMSRCRNSDADRDQDLREVEAWE